MNIPLKPVSMLKVATNTDLFPEFSGRINMINNMKKAIRICRPEDPKKLTVIPGEPLGQTFYKFLLLMENVRQEDCGHSYSLVNGEFCITMHFYYPDYNYTMYITPLEWLPLMKKRNKSLHDVIVRSIRLIAKSKHVEIMGDHGYWDLEEWIEEAIEYDNVECRAGHERDFWVKEMKHFKEHYPHYYSLLNSSDINTDPADIRKRIAACRKASTTEIEVRLLEWCERLIHVAELPGTMSSFVDAATKKFMEENELTEDTFGDTGYPLYPSQWITFTWLKDEYFTESYGQYLGDTAGNFGQLEMVFEVLCRTRKDFLNARDEYINRREGWVQQYMDVLKDGELMLDSIYDYIEGRLIEILKPKNETRKRKQIA